MTLDNSTQIDNWGRVQNMLDYSREAVEMVQRRGRDDFDMDRMLNLALTRLVELVGEAAWFVLNEFRAQHPQVPWTDIVGMRQHLTHGYADIKYNEVWRVVQEDLPVLISQLQAIISPPPPPHPSSSAAA